MVKTIFIERRTEEVIAELNGVLYEPYKNTLLYNKSRWNIADVEDKLVVHGVGMSHLERCVYVEK